MPRVAHGPRVLERSHRLTSSAGFTAATRRGRRAATRTLVLHLAAGSSSGPATGTAVIEPRGAAQVGFVVSRAVGNAVTRNRVRRRLRHLVRERVGQLPASSVLVVRALPPSAVATYAALGGDLGRALGRLGIAAEGSGHESDGAAR